LILLIQALVDKIIDKSIFIIPRADYVLLVIEGKQYELKMNKEQMLKKALQFIKAALEKEE
jgi:hypothetical protein